MKYNGYSNPSNISHMEIEGLFRVYLMVGFKCYYCSREMFVSGERNGNRITLEHRVPLSRGGKNTIDNFLFCCEKCNIARSLNER